MLYAYGTWHCQLRIFASPSSTSYAPNSYLPGCNTPPPRLFTSRSGRARCASRGIVFTVRQIFGLGAASILQTGCAPSFGRPRSSRSPLFASRQLLLSSWMVWRWLATTQGTLLRLLSPDLGSSTPFRNPVEALVQPRRSIASPFTPALILMWYNT
jgi:hypothetical protein